MKELPGRVEPPQKHEFHLSLLGTGLMAKMWATAATLYNTQGHPNRIVLHRVLSSDASRGEKFAGQYGFGYVSTDLAEFLGDRTTDIYGVVSRNTDHASQIRAITTTLSRRSERGRGKRIWCEKPLGLSTSEGFDLTRRAEKIGARTMVMHSYRGVTALQTAAKLRDAGLFGEIVQVRGLFDQDWTLDGEVPQGGDAPGLWRNTAAGNTNRDLNAHAIDMAMEFTGPLQAVSGLTHQFNAERPNWRTGTMQPCDCDDAALFQGRSASGVLLQGGSSRGMIGEKAAFILQVSGRKGGFKWDFTNPHLLQLYLHTFEGFDPKKLDAKSTATFDGALPSICRGWTTVNCTGGDFPGGVWVPGTGDFGWAHSFMEMMRLDLDSEEGNPWVPTFRGALPTLAVIDAIETAGRKGGTIKVRQFSAAK